MNAHTTSKALDELRLALGDTAVLTDAASLVLFSQDIFAQSEVPPVAILQPRETSQVHALTRIAANHGIALVPRGGGMSYTSGYVPQGAPNYLVVDTSPMSSIVTIDAENMFVVVEAGCTWKALFEALTAKGLRTPFWGPLSGMVATVGGSVSQNAAFWGSGAHGSAADSVLGVEVVLANGDLLGTGALARSGSPAFFRHYGPDLTGLFIGDCGAFGVKTRVALRLVHEAAYTDSLSFTFDDYGAMLRALSEVSRRGLVSQCVGFDPFLVQLRGRRDSMSDDFRALTRVLKGSRSLMKGLKDAAGMALAGRGFLADVGFTLHTLIEARSENVARESAEEVRAIALAAKGKEIDNTIPKVMRSTPFGPLNGVLGPNAERWVPVHGVMAHSRAEAAYAGIIDVLASHEEQTRLHGVSAGTLFSAIGQQAVIIEPMLFWPDEIPSLQRSVVSDGTRARIPAREPAIEARKLVTQIRRDIIATVDQLGAAHMQVGRTYPYLASLDPQARAQIEAIANVLKRGGAANPGVLGLP